MKNKRILITGGGGLLGRSVSAFLLKKGYKIILLDVNKPTVKNAICIEGSFNDEKLINKLLKKVDSVFHFAAMLGVDNCRQNKELLLKINYYDTKKFINQCVKNNIKNFLFTSSSEVYGNSPDIPYKENGKLVPVSTYGLAKVKIEKYLKKISENYNTKIDIVRLFNVYGYNQRKVFVVPIFIERVLENKDILIYGNGSQIRCFTYVEDAARGIISAYENNKSNYEIFNIGRNGEYTINQVAKIILSNFPKSKTKIKYVSYGTNGIREKKLEIARRVPSVEKAIKLLNFKAKISLEEGVEKIKKDIEKYKVF